MRQPDEGDGGKAALSHSVRRNIAQIRVMSRSAPLFYGVHVCNAVLLAYAFRHAAPVALVWLPALALIASCVWRSLRYYRSAVRPLSPDQATRRVAQVNVATGIFVAYTTIWSFSLATYGNDELRLHALIYSGLTILMCVSCLIQFRSASIVALSAIVPVSIAAFAYGSETEQTSALLLLVNGIAILNLVFAYSANFTALIRQHQDLKRAAEDIRRLSLTDTLTGLENRARFLERLNEAAGPAGGTVLVAVVGLDGFSAVNDLYGLRTGDEILRSTAERIMGVMQDRGFIGRLGGNEFGLALAGAGGRVPEELLDAVLGALREPYRMGAREVRLRASAGVAVAPLSAIDKGLVLEQAYDALRLSKAGRQGKWVLSSPEQARARQRREQVVHALRRADFDREMFLVFQPIVAPQDDGYRIVAFEALARWNNPELGVVPPMEFITAAEAEGLIAPLTDRLLALALATAATWPPEVHLYFNLSVDDVARCDFIERVAALIARSGIAPARLAFEVTETAVIRDFAEASAALSALKALGVAVALDDFGTGFSSLSYVHRLPMDKVKIDRSFVMEIETSRTCRDIVRSVIGLARSLQLACVAEGVETAGQEQILRRLGCTTMQGYRFAKPLRADDAALLAASGCIDWPAKAA